MISTPTLVDRLCVHCAQPATPALRLRTASKLGSLDLHSILPNPAAVLIVRMMKDPWPGQVRLEPGPELQWEMAAQQELSRWRRRALRPVGGVVPVHADAVLFADESEMLAALVVDLVRGRAASCWWWRAPLRRSELRRVDHLLVAHPQCVAGVFHYLEEWNRLMPLLRELSEQTVKELLVSLGRCYRVGWLNGKWIDQRPLAADRFSGSAAGAASTEQQEVSRGTVREGVSLVAGLQPFWSAANGVKLEKQLLVAVCRQLYHQPSLVSTDRFRLALEQLYGHAGARRSERAETQGQSPEAAPVGQRTQRERAPERPHFDVSEVTTPSSPLRDGSSSSHPAGGEPGVHEDQFVPASTANAVVGRTRGLAVTERIRDRCTAEAPGVMGIPMPDASDQSQACPSSRDGNLPPPLDVAGQPVSTRIGGVMYLINLMDWFDLPQCFEADWRLASELGGWGTLWHLGRYFVEASSLPDVDDDPLWRAIEELSGCEANSALREPLTETPDFRLPASWLAPTAPKRVDCYASPERIRILAEDGAFVLCDVLRNCIPCDIQLADELQRLGIDQHVEDCDVGQLRASELHLQSQPRQKAEILTADTLGRRWTALAAPFLLDRLQLAAGDASGLVELLRRIIECRAQLYVSKTHIDLVAPLDEISIAARIVGLDRDPGWVPAFGRVVQFHFR